MFRFGNGNHIPDNHLEKFRRDLRANNRTANIYCDKEEWEAWEEDFGELVATRGNVELRVNATIKALVYREYLIVHNCLIIGNRDNWQYYLMATRERREQEFTSPADSSQDSVRDGPHQTGE